MSGLELVVRPFQTSDISPPRPVPAAGATSATSQNTIINPGKNGNVKTFSGSYNLTVTYYYIEKPKEKKKDPTL
jgi:hypothetical protein